MWNLEMIELKRTPADELESLSVDEFRSLARSGAIASTASYRASWTGGEWRSVVSLPVFSDNAPANAYSQHERELRDMVTHIQEQMEVLDRRYASGELIEYCYGVGSLEEAGGASDVHGVARLISKPAFDSESVLTFVFKDDFFEIFGVIGKKSVWERWQNMITAIKQPKDGTTLRSLAASINMHTYDAEALEHHAGQLAYCVAPGPLTSWDSSQESPHFR